MSTIYRDQGTAPTVTANRSDGELDKLLTNCACATRAEPREPNTCVR
jgi:hypothetical protein